MVYKSPSRADSLERYYLGEAKEETEETESKLVLMNELPESDGVRIEEKKKEEEEVQKQQQHYCHDCQRGFRSGKAYGGHRSSAHSQSGREYQKGRGRGRGLGRRGSAADEMTTKKFVCEICEKVFSTRKSLYGHMRCHPDRSYRGMKPPSSSSSSSQPKKKKQKIRHHRRSPQLEEKEVTRKESSSSSPPPSDHHHSMTTTTMSSSLSSQSDNHQLLEEEDHGMNTVTDYNNYINTNPVDNNGGFDFNSDSSERRLMMLKEVEEEESPQLRRNKRRRGIIQKKGKGEEKKEKKKEKEKEKYICSICNRVFAIYQALGGHMSSHNKHSNNIETLDDHNCGCSSSENQSNHDNHHHRCHVCTKSFSSGQALGGHMRSHSQENNNNNNKQQKFFHFDLNVLPDDLL